MALGEEGMRHSCPLAGRCCGLTYVPPQKACIYHPDTRTCERGLIWQRVSADIIS